VLSEASAIFQCSFPVMEPSRRNDEIRMSVTKVPNIYYSRNPNPNPNRGGDGSPSNTVSPGPRRTSVPSDILIHGAVWPQQTWAAVRKPRKWGCYVPFRGEELGPHLTQCDLGRDLLPYQVAS